MVEWKALGDLGSYFGGLTGKTKEDFVDGNAKFITYMNVFTNPSLDISTTGVVKINQGEKQNRVQRGDILFTGSSETPEEAGMSCVVTEDLYEDVYMNSFCFGIRLYHPEQYNLGFLKHVLRSNKVRKEISKCASGVTRFNISKSRFGKVLIPMPSLSEQTRIVGILDTFTASIENLKEQIAERRKQYGYCLERYLSFGDNVSRRRIDSLFETFSGMTGVSNKWKETGNCQFIDYLNVYNNKTVDVNNLPYATVNSFKQNILKKSDILLTCASETPDECAMSSVIRDEIKDGIFLDDHLFAIRLKGEYKDEVDTPFLNYYMHSSSFRSEVCKKVRGVTRFYITGKPFMSIEIPIPQLSEQSRIVSILDTFEASIANLEAQLKEREKQYEYYRNKLLTFK